MRTRSMSASGRRTPAGIRVRPIRYRVKTPTGTGCRRPAIRTTTSSTATRTATAGSTASIIVLGCQRGARRGRGTAPNTFQLDRDIALGTPVPDGGQRSDDIGAACDPNPTDVNGHYHATALVRNICIGTTTLLCSTSADADADGIANAFDNCYRVANGPALWGPPPGFAQFQRDFDADGFSSVTGEIANVTGRLGLVGGLPGTAAGYDARMDLDYDNAIDIADLSLLIEYLFGSC